MVSEENELKLRVTSSITFIWRPVKRMPMSPLSSNKMGKENF